MKTEEINNLKAKIEILEIDNSNYKKINDDLKTMIYQFYTENDNFQAQNSSLQTENSELQKEVNNLKKIVSSLQPKKSDHQLNILDEDDIRNLQRIKEIGFGGCGKVTKVSKQHFYALKEMITQTHTYKNFKRFIAEYEIMNLLDHPNIIKTYGIFLSTETLPPSILLEYCPMNLNELIEQNKLSKEQIVCCIYQIVEGMKYIHFKKIIHRDLKPNNILIASDGTIKISDFGISKLMTIEEQSMTLGVGTQKYMAPEIINEDENYDEKVDVYSFGVVVFFILSGGQIPKIKVGDILNGKKAELPETFTSFAKKLINDCWNFKSSDRPSFEKILEEMKENHFELLELSSNEIKNIESFAIQHELKIPLYK